MIAGTSELGGRVDVHYRWAAGRAEWKSQADAGKLETATPTLYVVNDDSPYALGVYARAALARGRSVETLAGGRIKADRCGRRPWAACLSPFTASLASISIPSI